VVFLVKTISFSATGALMKRATAARDDS